jgi:(p)ppGpp synthase/HD superfamily hydrolase
MLVDEYGLSHKVLKVVLAVTKSKGLTKEQEERYYNKIKKDWRAILVKLSDRVNNLSTMQYFTPEKRLSYIEETREFVLPLCSHCKKKYSKLSNVITIMKYHITSICDTVKFMVQEQERLLKEKEQ